MKPVHQGQLEKIYDERACERKRERERKRKREREREREEERESKGVKRRKNDDRCFFYSVYSSVSRSGLVTANTLLFAASTPIDLENAGRPRHTRINGCGRWNFS